MAKPMKFNFKIANGTYEDLRILYHEVIAENFANIIYETFTQEQIDNILPILLEEIQSGDLC